MSDVCEGFARTAGPASDFQHLYAIIVKMFSEIGMRSLVHLQSLQQGHSYSMVGSPVSSGAPTALHNP